MTIALDNVVALVTGANGGIGRELCKALKAAHAIVIATDLSAEAPDVECDAYFRHDVTSEADWKAIAGEVQSRWGRLDGLVHNAGISIVTKIENGTGSTRSTSTASSLARKFCCRCLRKAAKPGPAALRLSISPASVDFAAQRLTQLIAPARPQ
jgi:NAD(P)-dependent dehydrogenase (short-subunit alcohol dehydrogenase family)